MKKKSYFLFREWYKNPKLKFKIIERFEKLIPQMLPIVSENAGDSAYDVKGGELVKDNIEFTEHHFSNYVAARTILSSAGKYAELSKEKISREKLDRVREGMIKELKWD